MTATILNRKVLVLNQSWVPLDVWSLKKAITLLFKAEEDGTPKAKIIKYSVEEVGAFSWSDWAKLVPSDKESILKSPDNKFKIPEIIVLQGCNRFPKPKSSFSRRAIYQRDGNQCMYCGAKPGTSELSIDHIHPTSRGGKNTWENVCLCCTKCNGRKGNKTMKEVGFKFFIKGYKPTKPKAKLFDVSDIKCDSWKNFMDESFWNVELKD